MPLAPPKHAQVLDRRGRLTPAYHHHLLNLAHAISTGSGGSGGGPTPPAEPLVTGESPTDFITANGDVVVAGYG